MWGEMMIADARDLPDDELTDEELDAIVRAAVERAVERQLAAGYPVYSSGIGADADKLYMDLPDGRRFQYDVDGDGRPVIIREIAR